MIHSQRTPECFRRSSQPALQINQHLGPIIIKNLTSMILNMYNILISVFCIHLFYLNISCIRRTGLYGTFRGWEASLFQPGWSGKSVASMCIPHTSTLCCLDRRLQNLWLQTSLARWMRICKINNLTDSNNELDYAKTTHNSMIYLHIYF